MNRELVTALTDAARHMEKHYNWYFGIEGTDSLQTEVDPEFIETMHNFVFPLLDHDALLKVRVARLNATKKAVEDELAALGEVS